MSDDIEYQDTSPCPMGCIFYKGELHGDCRIPWSTECEMVRRDKERGCVTDKPLNYWDKALSNTDVVSI